MTVSNMKMCLALGCWIRNSENSHFFFGYRFVTSNPNLSNNCATRALPKVRDPYELMYIWMMPPERAKILFASEWEFIVPQKLKCCYSPVQAAIHRSPAMNEPVEKWGETREVSLTTRWWRWMWKVRRPGQNLVAITTPPHILPFHTVRHRRRDSSANGRPCSSSKVPTGRKKKPDPTCWNERYLTTGWTPPTLLRTESYPKSSLYVATGECVPKKNWAHGLNNFSNLFQTIISYLWPGAVGP